MEVRDLRNTAKLNVNEMKEETFIEIMGNIQWEINGNNGNTFSSCISCPLLISTETGGGRGGSVASAPFASKHHT